MSWRKLSKLFDLRQRCSFITWINYRTTFKFWSARNHPYVPSQCAMNVSVKIESAIFKGWAWRLMFAVGCLWRMGQRGQEGGRGQSSYLESFHWCPPAYVVALGRADALTLDSFMLLCISRRYCLDQWLCSRLCSEMIIVFDVGNLIFLNTFVAYPLLITFRRMK